MTSDMQTVTRLVIVGVILTILASLDVARMSRRKPEFRRVAIGGMIGAMLALLGLLILWFFGEQ